MDIIVNLEECPSDWRRTKIEELFEISGGFPAPKGYDPFSNGTIPFVRMQDLGRFHRTMNLTETKDKLNAQYVKNRKLRITKKGSILIPRSGSVSLNHRAILGRDACIVSHICVLTPKDSKNDIRYLYFALCNFDMRRIMKKTTGLDSVSFEDVKIVEIPIPPLDVQRNIANYLEKVIALGFIREEANQMANKILQVVFIEIFGDPYANPKNWKKVRLADVCTRITDGTHVTPSYQDSGIVFLSAKNIRGNSLDLDNVKYISVEEHKRLTKRVKPQKHDILYRKVGVGYGQAKAIEIENELSIFVSLALIKPNHSLIDWKFLETMMNSQFVKRQAKQRIKGIGVPDLHLVEIRNFEILLPPIHLQKQFSNFVEKIEMLLGSLNESTESINQLFQSLMSKAFKGELVSPISTDN